MSSTAIDYYPFSFKLSDGAVINVKIWDTCGQEKYNSICELYYKRADGILLVYDISNEHSFNRIKKYYIKKIRDNC